MQLLIPHQFSCTSSWISIISTYVRKSKQSCWVTWKYYLTHYPLLIIYSVTDVPGEGLPEASRLFPQIFHERWQAENHQLKNWRNKHSRTGGSWAARTAQKSRASARAPIGHFNSYKQRFFNFFGSTISYETSTVLCLYLKTIKRYYRSNSIPWSSCGPHKMDSLTAHSPVPDWVR